MNNTPEILDVFDEMTKDEILHWLHSQASFVIYPPRRSEIMYWRWDFQAKLLMERRHEHTRKLEAMDSKARDDLARKFNASTDWKEKNDLMKKMLPYEIKMKAWWIAEHKLMADEKKNDDYMEAIEKQRELEKGIKS